MGHALWSFVGHVLLLTGILISLSIYFPPFSCCDPFPCRGNKNILTVVISYRFVSGLNLVTWFCCDTKVQQTNNDCRFDIQCSEHDCLLTNCRIRK